MGPRRLPAILSGRSTIVNSQDSQFVNAQMATMNARLNTKTAAAASKSDCNKNVAVNSSTAGTSSFAVSTRGLKTNGVHTQPAASSKVPGPSSKSSNDSKCSGNASSGATAGKKTGRYTLDDETALNSSPKRPRTDIDPLHPRNLDYEGFEHLTQLENLLQPPSTAPPRIAKTGDKALDNRQHGKLEDAISRAVEKCIASPGGAAIFQEAVFKAMTAPAVEEKLGSLVTNALPIDIMVQEIRDAVSIQLEEMKSSWAQKLQDMKEAFEFVTPTGKSVAVSHGGASYSSADVLVKYAEVEFENGNTETLCFLRSEVAKIMGARSETSFVELFLKVHYKSEPEILLNTYQKLTKATLKKNPDAKLIDPRVKQILIYLLVHKYRNISKLTVDDATLNIMKRAAIPHITRALHNLKPKEKKVATEFADSEGCSSSDDDAVGPDDDISNHRNISSQQDDLNYTFQSID